MRRIATPEAAPITRWATMLTPQAATTDQAITPKSLLFAAPAVLALAGLATWFYRERGGVSRRSTQVRDVMVHEVVTIAPSATLAETAALMRDSNVGILPIVEKGTVVGVITDRDLVVRALAEGADPTRTEVGEFASVDTICARPDTPLDEAMEVMAECQVGRLPVLDYDDRVMGIVTLSSLALRSREKRETLHTAQEVARRSTRAA
jgi:CBS domain-containing protein